VSIHKDLYVWPKYDENVKEGLRRFCSGQDFADWNLGDIYTEVPKAWAHGHNCEFGIFCNSGTSGLHANLLSLPLRPSDEIIVPAMTFIRAVTPLSHLGLIPVLADLDSETGNLSPESVEAALSPRTRAVICVHMWGIPADMKALRTICDQNGLFLIEDFSHAHFAHREGWYVGSHSDVAFASLQRKKTFSVGEGGIIMTSNQDIFRRLQHITSPGSFPDDHGEIDFSGVGLNMRMSPFSAVVARELLKQKEKILKNRNQAAQRIIGILGRDSVNGYIIGPLIPQDTTPSWYSIKPKLIGIDLSSLGTTSLLKIRPFGYSCIADNPFWKKSKKYFPFCSMPEIKIPSRLDGYCEYVRNRITIEIPTLKVNEWTDAQTDLWEQDLIEAIEGAVK
jgi:perosamine synthetase